MNAYTRQDLSVMQAWPLERKIRVTQAKIIEWYHHYDGKVAVSFSGGKDSTVLLDLARRAFPDIPAVFVDTGLEYPEIREFVKTVPNVTWLRPEMPFSKVIRTAHAGDVAVSKAPRSALYASGLDIWIRLFSEMPHQAKAQSISPRAFRFIRSRNPHCRRPRR